MSGDYVRWDAPGVEPPVEDEAGKTEELKGIVRRVQEKNFSKHRHAFRATHVKTQGIVKGTLTTLSDLPPHLAQGLFAQQGKKHDVALRYANEPSFLQDDKTNAPRGVGLKVFQVEDDGAGWLEKEGEETKTQDFTFNNAPSLELTDLPTTVEIFSIREKNFDSPTGLTAQLAVRSDRLTQMAPYMLPNVHPLGMTMFSQSAYRFGEYVAKWALFPTTELQKSLESQKVTSSAEPEELSIWLKEFFDKNDAEYDFRVQILQNLDDQSVENCAKEWSQDKYPFKIVAKLHIPKGQDSFDPKRRTFWEDNLKLNPWYGLKAHQPLGSVNRLRKEIYAHSVSFRKTMNATELKTIKSVDEIP